MHYYKFNIADWHLGTSHLSLEEEAAYLRLINYYYDTEEPIPLETDRVFRRLRLGKGSVVGLSVLDEFFTKTNDGWIHDRCDRELESYQEKADANRKNGKKGGRPKKNNDLGDNPDKPSGFSVVTQKEPTDNLNQEPLTTNQEPLTTNQLPAKPEQGKPAKSKSDDLDYSSWPAMPNEQTLKDWHAMRKRIKANVSQTVINNFSSQLAKSAEAGFTVDECLSECVARNWRGFKFEWMVNAASKPGGKPVAARVDYTPEDYSRGINSDGSF